MPLFVTVTIYEIVFDNKIVAIYTFMFDYEYKFFWNTYEKPRFYPLHYQMSQGKLIGNVVILEI